MFEVLFGMAALSLGATLMAAIENAVSGDKKESPKGGNSTKSVSLQHSNSSLPVAKSTPSNSNLSTINRGTLNVPMTCCSSRSSLHYNDLPLRSDFIQSRQVNELLRMNQQLSHNRVVVKPNPTIEYTSIKWQMEVTKMKVQW